MDISEANLSAKRKPEDDLENKPILKKQKETDQERLASKKTLFIGLLPPEAEISDIINFFKDVGQVVRVQRLVNKQAHYRRIGFVEFARHKEAKMAQQMKNGDQYLLDNKIFLTGAQGRLSPKFCIDHKVWYQDESLPIEEDEDETPLDSVEKYSLLLISLPKQLEYHISSISSKMLLMLLVFDFVNHEGKHVGYAFVEFPSAHQAKEALENKNGEYLHDHKILLMKGPSKTPNSVEAATVIEKTIYVANLSHETEISHIINFFKDVGEVVHVRLMVNKKGKHVGDGFVEFASTNEAQKALENKNGEYLHDCQIFLDVVETNPYPPYRARPMYCIDHKVWYEDYIRQETLLVEEDAAVEGFEETPDFVEEVAAREKTVFVANVSQQNDALCDISHINRIFNNVGKIVRVRLIIDHKNELAGCCFIEFASTNEAKKAVQWRDGSLVYVNVAEIAPYPFRRKYNLYKLAEKLWYEDNLRREDLGLTNKPKLKMPICFSPIIRGKKITFSYDD